MCWGYVGGWQEITVNHVQQVRKSQSNRQGRKFHVIKFPPWKHWVFLGGGGRPDLLTVKEHGFLQTWISVTHTCLASGSLPPLLQHWFPPCKTGWYWYSGHEIEQRAKWNHGCRVLSIMLGTWRTPAHCSCCWLAPDPFCSGHPVTSPKQEPPTLPLSGGPGQKTTFSTPTVEAGAALFKWYALECLPCGFGKVRFKKKTTQNVFCHSARNSSRNSQRSCRSHDGLQTASQTWFIWSSKQPCTMEISSPPSV